MKVSYEILNILIFLIPGFFASLIYNSVVVRKSRDHFTQIIEALIYALIIYSLVLLITGKNPITFSSVSEKSTIKYFFTPEVKPLVCIFIFSLFLPLLLGFFNTQKYS